jgi:hypothetical protein
VAEPTDETTGEFGEEAGEERRAQGSTVAGLNAFSAGVDSGIREKLGYGDPDDAMLALASAVEKGTLRVPRLLVLDSLVRLAKGRGGDELKARDDALDTLLRALIADKRGPETDLGEAASTVRVALDSVASLKGLDAGAHPWEVFAQQAGPALQLTQAEIEKPMCNDREVVIKGPYKAIGVTVEFHTDASPGELRQFCDPRRWHECSAYQKEMTPWTGPGAMPDEDRPPDGWRRDLLETVQLAPGKTLVTPLRFTHTIQTQNDPSWVHLDYVMIGDTKEIKVDEGFLDVRRVTSGKDSGRTRVVAKKAIFFDDPLLTNWPTVACDTFWMDLVIDAAVGCLGPHATIDSTGGKPKMAASKEVPLTEVIERATDAARKSITAYGKLANEAATQLTGDSPAKADKWVELATRTWAQAAQDAARAWTTYVALLQAVAESGGGDKESGAKDTKAKGGGT